jgi:phosphoglycerol transferase MdoB-like AlkP superfamily enzyme
MPIFRRPALLGLGLLLLLSISRVYLVTVYSEQVAATDGLAFILLQGVRYDLILLGMLFGPVLLALPWLHRRTGLRRVGRWAVPLYLALVSALAFFIEAASRAFIDEYGNRPNYLFVEYLRYPREVLAMLSGTHLVELVVFSTIAILIAVLLIRWLRRDPSWNQAVSLKHCLLATPLIALLLLAMIRSTWDHRPVNPSNAAFSVDTMVNQLPLNSPYSLIYAIYEHRRNATGQTSYGEMEQERLVRLVLKDAGLPVRRNLQSVAPSLHRQVPTQRRDRPLNIVILLMESIGADHVGALGGLDLTPELDLLADEGIWMERLYATGVRSARGIEAVITGFTPSPQEAVIKQARTQDDFFTIAELLQDQGYATSFIYGGESHFDNMRRFFLNNGFDRVIDENDYEAPIYYGGWGVSDEDLFNRAHQEFSAAGNTPFFSLVFTSSNHEPFDIPEGRVSVESGADGPRNTAIRYTDYALGQFLERARQSEYWKNTLFLVISDHSAHKWGGELVPTERFRIPGVIVGGQIEPRRVPGIVSQIDMLPTLLSLAGVDSIHPAIGRDLTRPEYLDGAGRAMMQFHGLQAWVEDPWVIILRPGHLPRGFQRDSEGNYVWGSRGPSRLRNKALAHALWGPLMISTGGYSSQH